MTPLLDRLNKTSIKSFTLKELIELCSEIRQFLRDSVSKTGGHLSSNLGVVELTVALHYIFNFPEDSLVFDVSHQSYVHKILTGRLDQFDTLRQFGGLSGFTNPLESEYDTAQVGHAGTAISSMMGLQKAKMLTQKQPLKSFGIALVGDAAISNGVSFEALNNITHNSIRNGIIILNDNQMSISESVGSVSKILTRLISNSFYNRSRRYLKKILKIFGAGIFNFFGRLRFSLKNYVAQNIFENFGVRYLGPIDGHDLKSIISLFQKIQKLSLKNSNPILIHAVTKKGKGFNDSEQEPEKYHGVATKPVSVSLDTKKNFTSIFSETLIELAEKNDNIIAITAAMKSGTGLSQFSEKYPNRFFDVGIAESHGVAFGSFSSFSEKIRPFIAIYSTFLQRALDQIFQEVVLQPHNNPIFIIDRAGICAEDGATHHGIFDIAYLKTFPKLVLLSPKNEIEFKEMLHFAYHNNKHPFFIRIAKTTTQENLFKDIPHSPLLLGKSEWLIKNSQAKLTIMTYGPIVSEILSIQDKIPCFNLINLRFAKPLDKDILKEALDLNLPIVTLEEHSLIGGVGESIKALQNKISPQNKGILSLGFPDELIPHGSRDILLENYGLKGQSLIENIENYLTSLT